MHLKNFYGPEKSFLEEWGVEQEHVSQPRMSITVIPVEKRDIWSSDGLAEKKLEGFPVMSPEITSGCNRKFVAALQDLSRK